MSLEIITFRKTAQFCFRKEISKSVPSIFEKLIPLDDTETNCQKEIDEEEEELKNLQSLSPETESVEDDRKFLPSVKVLAAKFTLLKVLKNY